MVLTANVIRGLTGGIDANAITFGTLSNARLPSSISVGNVSGNGVGLYGLSASNVSTGTIDNARLPSTITSNFVGSGAGLANINGANVSGVLDADLVWMAGTIDGSLTIADRVTANTVVVSNGSASAPSVTFAGNTSTGVYLPTANTIGFTTGGTTKMTVDPNGNVGINTATPTANLDVFGDALLGYALYSSFTSRLRIRTGIGNINNSNFDTGLSLNSDNGGGSIVFALTTQNAAGDRTYTGLYYIRRYYDNGSTWTSSANTVATLTTLYNVTAPPTTTFSASASANLLVTITGSYNYKWYALVL